MFKTYEQFRLNSIERIWSEQRHTHKKQWAIYFGFLPFVAPQPVAMPCKNELNKEFSKSFYMWIYFAVPYIQMRETFSTCRQTSWFQEICKFHFAVESQQGWKQEQQMPTFSMLEYAWKLLEVSYLCHC